jgi:hypothetical protein
MPTACCPWPTKVCFRPNTSCMPSVTAILNLCCLSSSTGTRGMMASIMGHALCVCFKLVGRGSGLRGCVFYYHPMPLSFDVYHLVATVCVSLQSCKNLQFTFGSGNQQNFHFVNSIARRGALSLDMWHCHSHRHCENGTHNECRTNAPCSRRRGNFCPRIRSAPPFGVFLLSLSFLSVCLSVCLSFLI